MIRLLPQTWTWISLPFFRVHIYDPLWSFTSYIPKFNKLWFLSIIAATMSFTYATLGVGLSIAKVAGIVLSYTLPLFSIIGRLYGISTSNTKPIAVILLALYIELQISYFMSSLVCWNLKLMRNNPWEISRKWSDSRHSGWNRHSQLRYSSPKSLEDLTSSWWHRSPPIWRFLFLRVWVQLYLLFWMLIYC